MLVGMERRSNFVGFYWLGGRAVSAVSTEKEGRCIAEERWGEVESRRGAAGVKITSRKSLQGTPLGERRLGELGYLTSGKKEHSHTQPPMGEWVYVRVECTAARERRRITRDWRPGGEPVSE
ncbi:hypothetical protein Tco_0996895 [Tanacetum coccineum]